LPLSGAHNWGWGSIPIGVNPYPMLFDPVGVFPPQTIQTGLTPFGVLCPGILQLIEFLQHDFFD